MASINYAAREINVKIVYYGPGLSGKTTNLQVIHKKVPPEFKSDMVSLYYDDSVEDLHFWWEKPNNHWS